MKVGGWTVDADYLVGRRFTYTNGSNPDITFVSAGEDGHGFDQVRAHRLDGRCEWMPISAVRMLMRAGILVEAAGVPFVNDRRKGA